LPPGAVPPPPPGLPPATTPQTTPSTPTPTTPTPAPTPPAAPTPLPPANAAYVGHPTPVAAWAAAQGLHGDLAHYYQAPYRGPQQWGAVEYLMWWVRPGPVPVPLVNTTLLPEDLASSTAAGGIFDPNAVTLFGNQTMSLGTFSGVRLVAGRWLDNCQDVGFEGSVFLLQQRSQTANFVGGAGPLAQPAVTVPFNGVGGAIVGETAATIAGPFGGLAVRGEVDARYTSDLWGADADLLHNICKGETWRFDAIGGVKFLELTEHFTFRTNVVTAPFGGTFDEFRTTDRFYGGELGARAAVQMDRFGLELTGKVAMGDDHETLEIRGISSVPPTFGGGFAPGGLFAQSSNIGKHDTDRFSVVPHVAGKLWYDWSCHFRTYVGYDFMYWVNVMRAGDQIDRNVNTNLAPVFGGSGAGAGPAVPAQLNRNTDFWVHGLSFGFAATW
jgi:hypothetical protein